MTDRATARVVGVLSRITGDALVAGRDWANAVLGVVAFSVSGLILNYVLWRADLVPRWLASWGLAGAVLHLATAVMVLCGLEPLSATQNLLQAPLGAQEMVFAIWLMVKGFNPSRAERPTLDRQAPPGWDQPNVGVAR